MKKVQAGGHIRTALDNSWLTPESILERARVFFGGAIPFDPATSPENPTQALRFCAGAPGTLFARPTANGVAFPGCPCGCECAGCELARSNGLEVSWDWPTWVNPPYGTELAAWLRKIELEATRGTRIVALLPASRWETHLQRTLRVADAVCFHRGRIAFVSAVDGVAVAGNPSASMLLGFNVDRSRFAEAFASLGLCLGLHEIRGAS